MDEVIEVIFEKLDEHWVKFVTAGAFMLIGWFFGRRKAHRDFQRREFYDRLNVSLNIIRDGKLLIRTLLEKTGEEIFLNSTAANAIVEAGKKTTEADPLLPLPKDDYWYYLNSVLNEISEKFADGQLKRDLGLGVTCAQYVLCLTSEAAGNIRMRKIRAMLIQKSTLETLPEEQPQLAAASHATRWTTLQQLAKAYRETPHKFLTVEICQ